MATFATGFGMSRTTLGIDVDSRQIRAAAIAHGRGDAGLLQTAAVVQLADYKSPADALRALAQKVGAHGGHVHCNIGRISVLVQEAEFPQMDAHELRAAVQIEGEQLMPDIQSQVLESEVIGKRTTMPEGRLVLRVLLVAAPRAVVKERADWCASAGVPATAIVPDGLAMANALAALRPPESGVAVAVEVGEEGSTLVAIGPEKDASAPIVRGISGGVDILSPAAGAASEGKSGADRNWTSSKSERWLREIERSIEFATEKLGSPVQQLLVTGDGALSTELLGFLSQSVSASVATWNPLAELKRGPSAPGEDFVKRHGFNCAVAVGLALQEGN